MGSYSIAPCISVQIDDDQSLGPWPPPCSVDRVSANTWRLDLVAVICWAPPSPTCCERSTRKMPLCPWCRDARFRCGHDERQPCCTIRMYQRIRHAVSHRPIGSPAAWSHPGWLCDFCKSLYSFRCKLMHASTYCWRLHGSWLTPRWCRVSLCHPNWNLKKNGKNVIRRMGDAEKWIAPIQTNVDYVFADILSGCCGDIRRLNDWRFGGFFVDFVEESQNGHTVSPWVFKANATRPIFGHDQRNGFVEPSIVQSALIAVQHVLHDWHRFRQIEGIIFVERDTEQRRIDNFKGFFVMYFDKMLPDGGPFVSILGGQHSQRVFGRFLRSRII